MADKQDSASEEKPKDTKSLPMSVTYGYIKQELDRERQEIWKSGYDKGFYDAKKLYLDTGAFIGKLDKLVQVATAASTDSKPTRRQT